MDRLLNNKGIFEQVASGNALDLGCGKGDDAIDLAKRGFVVDAVDKNSVSIEALEQKAKSEGLNVRPILQSIEDFKIEEAKYSLIVANNSLPFTGSKEKAAEVIRNVARGLKTGGFVYITLFGLKDEWSVKKDMSFFTQEEGIELLEGLGLKRYFISTEEGYGKTMKGSIKFWQIHKFLYQK